MLEMGFKAMSESAQRAKPGKFLLTEGLIN